MVDAHDQYLAHASSDESDNESGYDSEAAEVSKTTTKRGLRSEHAAKRRKLSHSSVSEIDDYDEDDSDNAQLSPPRREGRTVAQRQHQKQSGIREANGPVSTSKAASQQDTHQGATAETTTKPTATLPAIHNGPGLSSQPSPSSSLSANLKKKSQKSDNKKPPWPGVIYLSSLPPYLRPSALRNLLSQRGFGPISRLFLTPASKPQSNPSSTAAPSSKSSRKLYTEGWLEFPSHKTAKLCAQTLNATPIGGKKGGYYRDDLWNMRYLRGMAWGELMAGVQGERREEEAKRDEERREIAREQKRFVEGVEKGRRWEGLENGRRKKQKRGKENLGEQDGGGDGGEAQWTWRQFEVKKGGDDGTRGADGHSKGGKSQGDEVNQDAREVLSKIF